MTEKPILIVDDEKSIRFMIAEALRAPGVKTEEASDGPEALSRLDREEFSLVLLDLRLPGMNGMDVLRQARQARPDIPVVVITAYGTVGLAVEAMRLGAADFIQKPFVPDDVRKAVARALRRFRLHEDRVPEYAAEITFARESILSSHLDAAEEHLRTALSLEVRPEVLNLMGAVEEMRGNRSEAEKHYRAALSLDPAYEPARFNLERLARTPPAEAKGVRLA